jgi:hypothetical protein
LERLEAEITELAGHLTAAECRWILLTAEYDRRAGYLEWGCQSCAHWLSWHCGLNVRAARERVRVGRALETLPLTTAAFSEGVLSYSKVRALTRVATPANESALLEVATHGTAVQVEKAVRAYRRVTKHTETDEANERHMARYLRYDWGDDGSLEGTFRIPPEMAAIFLKGVDVARHRIPEEPTGEGGPAGPPCPFAATNIDALVMMAEAFLCSDPVVQSGGDRFQIVVNVDEAVLSNDADGISELDDGPALAPETVRRLACDASIVHAVHDADRLVGTSEKAPAIPAATRRAVRARDKGCRSPGCGARGFTNIHHVKHRAHFGGKELTNLVELCWFHHRLVHEGGWNVRLEAGGELLAIRPNGNVLPRPRRVQPDGRHGIEHQNRERGVSIDPTTCIPRWYGDRFDLNEIVSGLVAADA